MVGKLSSSTATARWIALINENEDAFSKSQLHNTAIKMNLFIREQKKYCKADQLHYSAMVNQLRWAWSESYNDYQDYLNLLHETKILLPCKK